MDLKEKVYKKEIIVTIVFVLLYVMVCHFVWLFVLFPGLQVGTLWGFPTHYILPILMGWFGLIIVSGISAYVCNRLDEEIEAANQADQPASGKGGE
ncbi:MAG: hypothetical protein PHU03_07610 [Syntrophales bacterium]|nr:hypothetical protein [Syntrophales bacterium]